VAVTRHVALGVLAVAACGGSFDGHGTPEQVVAGAKDGQQIETTGEVFQVTWDSVQNAARKKLLAGHSDSVEYVLEQEDEEKRAIAHAFEDVDAKYPRTQDRYILIRTTKPAGITFGEPGFTPGKLEAAWGLGVHVTLVDGAHPLPEIGAHVKVTGTFKRITWNAREVTVPVIENPTITIVDQPAPLAGPGEACTLDQACNAQLVCDRTSLTCVPPPREIYWADPWRDVNGACDTDADCPLGQVCDPSYTIASTGDYATHYFTSIDAGRHICTLAPNARSVAAQCPRIYTTRDLVGARFVTGKEICVRVRSLTNTIADDRDTHAQMQVDEPIPFPTADLPYHLFGGCTEVGPIYKDPSVPGGPVLDPASDVDLIAIGTYKYDPDHGWHEIHPVKAYLPAP
jgi:hypothetical protein